MRLFSLFRKNTQETVADDSVFYSRSESESSVQNVRARKRKSSVKPAADNHGNTPVDPVLPEKKRARRRLVGAVALVLAVIIGLPMVLDSEPKQLPDDLTIEIPSKDPTGVTKSIPEKIVAPVTLPAAVASVPAAEHAPAQTSAPVATAPVAEQKNDTVAPVKTALQPAQPVVKALPAVPAPKTDSGARTAVIKSEPVSVPVRPASVPVAKALPQDKGEDKHVRFTMQVAALASHEKAEQLRTRLKAAGIASYVQKTGSGNGERLRVRIGPLHSREDADRLRARLALLGLNGTLIPSTL